MMASAKMRADGRSMALLPPIPLYRRLLRAHRKFLPGEMRLLGDEYVKAEFRAHREVDNPIHLVSFIIIRCNRLIIFVWKFYLPKAHMKKKKKKKNQIGFLTEWQLYAQKIEGDSWVGEKLDRAKIEKMSGRHHHNRSPQLFASQWHKKLISYPLFFFFLDEQLGQLYELMKAIQNRDSDDEEPSS